jgi:hypothetical protein
MSYEVLFEDEDDIFTKSPSTKYFDILKGSNEEIAKEELDKVFQKLAALEMIYTKEKGDNFERELNAFIFDNLDEVENYKKSLYIEHSGDIICRLDS